MINWNEEKNRFFVDASQYTGYHKDLAAIIKPYLKPEWTMCDMGCGLGLLDIQLADSVAHITAIDRNESAISDYNRRVKDLNITNISAKVGDANKLKDDKWDVLLLSFFSFYGDNDAMERALSRAGHRIIMITFIDEFPEKQRKFADANYRETTSAKETYILGKGYNYEKIIKTMDFGQPFRSLDDAYKFFDQYSKDEYMKEEDSDKRKDDIHRKMSDIVLTDGNSEFPYFLSKKKDIGILIIDV